MEFQECRMSFQTRVGMHKCAEVYYTRALSHMPEDEKYGAHFVTPETGKSSFTSLLIHSRH